jgi:peptide/nickel transport system substrate-binding protein/oligopeptide transport system substrate-binding protein
VRKLAALVAIPLAATVGLAACGSDSGSGGSGSDYVASIGIGEPQFLVPQNTTESNGHDVLNALFTPLVKYDEELRPVEVAAESITTEDNKTWTIKLRDGWTFHNGEPVTSDSYINAWNAGAYGPNAYNGNYFFEKIEGYADLNPADAKATPKATKLTGLKKVDDTTFTVVLSEPYVNFKSMLGYNVFFPMPNAAFADVATNKVAETYNEAPIGQGPFKMKGTWQHDQQIETETYADYQGEEKPKVGGVRYKIYQQQTTQYQDMLAGQLDVVPVVPLENISNAKADIGDRFVQSPASLFQFLAFPTFDPKFKSLDIRKGISMAIDREEIVKTIFADSQKAAHSFVSPVVPGFRDNTCGDACEFNPTEAKKVFDAAGGAAAVGNKIEIAYNEDGGHKPWVDATCNQIKKNLGVECVGKPEPKFAELLTKVEAKQPVGVFRLGWSFDYPAMENYLAPLYSTNGSSNYYGYSNAEFDKLVADGDKAKTPEEATKLYQQAEDKLAADLPVLPLRFGQNNFAYSTNVTNVSMDLFNTVELLKLEASNA